MNGVPGAVQLLSARHPGRSRPDDGYAFPGAVGRGFRFDPAHGKGVFNDILFNLFDGHRCLVDAKYACLFARGRTKPPSEFREIVGAV